MNRLTRISSPGDQSTSGKKNRTRVNNLFNSTRGAATSTSAPLPSLAGAASRTQDQAYENIKVAAHRPEDIAAVRDAVGQLQSTWEVYRQLGRPANLATTLGTQMDAVSRAVDYLANLPPFTITVPRARSVSKPHAGSIHTAAQWERRAKAEWFWWAKCAKRPPRSLVSVSPCVSHARGLCRRYLSL